MKYFEKIESYINELSKKNLFILLTGFVMYVLAINEYFLPSTNHSQRWVWLFNWADEIHGIYGSMIVYLALGTILTLYAVINKNNI
jgi:hypothetical protein